MDRMTGFFLINYVNGQKLSQIIFLSRYKIPRLNKAYAKTTLKLKYRALPFCSFYQLITDQKHIDKPGVLFLFQKQSIIRRRI